MRFIGIALLLCCLPLGAEIIQVGTGTAINQALPWEPSTSFSYSQQVYLAAEIGSSGVIGSVAFQYTLSNYFDLACNQSLKIWLGHTDGDFLANWAPLDSLSLVFDGELSTANFSSGTSGQGWLTVPLDTPFFFDGARNLLLAVDENSPGGSSVADDFLATEATAVRGLVYKSMTVNPNPASPPASGYFNRQYFANLRLDLTYFSYTPYLPNPPDGATGVAASPVLQWQSNAAEFDVYFGTSAGNLALVAAGSTAHQWWPAEPLPLLQTCFWQVKAWQDGVEYPGPVWTFTTQGEGIGPPQNFYAYYITDRVQLGWSPPSMGNPQHYRVIRGGTFLAVCDSLSYADFEIVAGGIYSYQILAVNQLGEISLPSTTVTVHVPADIPNLILQEGFESCVPFSQNLAPWQSLDLDGAPTWSWNGLDFPGEGGPLGWLSFFPGQTDPPLTTVSPHSGAAMLASLSSLTPPSDDWLISPRLNLGNLPQLGFWARSHTADYGLERLRVLISVTNPDPSSFVALSGGDYLSVPALWTEYSYDLGAWQGQSVYLAWQGVSWDAFALYLDDILVTGEDGYVPTADATCPPATFSVYPNPSGGSFTVSNHAKTKFELTVYDLRGRRLHSATGLDCFDSAASGLDLPAGLYLLKLESGGARQLKRIAVIR